ncbi:DNA polymerase Y family protein [Ideonella sp. A 288]|uniref:Y-family DNA polymerase n=1 Tax=Ideonella sp. A 288 TaxID=1962181 RepID=UPI000B4BED89|nr:DNA polymerase Y family protein [Ideonella sp. A 288]
MLWIALHLPALSLESFAATLGPAQAGRPVALLESHRIVQADAAAQALGVQPGMKRATALALAPVLVLGAADVHRDAQALVAVAHAALAFTPSVAVSGQGVRLEVHASLRYFGGLVALLARLKTALRPLGHRVQLATAPTALGAALLARWRPDLEAGPHSTALGPLRTLLDRAPVGLLGPALGSDAAAASDEAATWPSTWEALQGMGLHTLADLRALPRSGLARRFGPGLLLAVDRARGDAPEPHTWVELPASFASRLELFTRADLSEQVIAGAGILLARLVAWAQAQHGRIARFTLVMHHERRHRDADDPAAQATALEVVLAEPAIDPAHLQLLLTERLARTPMPAPTLELGLRCDAVVPGEAPNGELFPTRASEHAGLTRLVERLQARLGREQVCRLDPVAEHRPERATQASAADAATVGRQGAVPGRAAPGVAQVTRPVWLWPEPQPLPEHGARPLLDGRPLQLLAGPERIETGWWDGALAARDYFIAATGDGTLVWIYRARLPLAADGEGSGWFLHGRFA